MSKGKIIVIEGTDCSGKASQTGLLLTYLKQKDIKVAEFSYPRYDTPTGKIVGGPYLGKSYICEGWFPEGADAVDPRVASLYYAADRLYNAKAVQEKLDEGYTVLLDRYIYSSMAHQGGKYRKKEDRLKMYKFIEDLEFNLLGLPKPDAVIFLLMPPDEAKSLRTERAEKLDQHEANDNHLRHAAESYLELAKLYNFNVINCIRDGKPRTREDIHAEVIKVYDNLTR